MLSLLFSKNDVHKAMDVHPCITDENVNLCWTRPIFQKEAWPVENVVKQVKENPTWLCNVCKSDVEEESVPCDSWYHFQCASLKKAPKAKFRFC